jgi:hypothetical protein
MPSTVERTLHQVKKVVISRVTAPLRTRTNRGMLHKSKAAMDP